MKKSKFKKVCVKGKNEDDIGATKEKKRINNKKGMELVQVGILIAIAIVIGLIFRNEIMSFVENVFSELNDGF